MVAAIFGRTGEILGIITPRDDEDDALVASALPGILPAQISRGFYYEYNNDRLENCGAHNKNPP